MFGCQQNLLDLPEYEREVLKFVCQQANSLRNCAIYSLRQAFFMTGIVDDNPHPVQSHLKSNDHYRILYSQAAQQLIAEVAESFTAFKETLAAFYEGKVDQRPRLPKYRKKGGLSGLTFPKQAISLDVENALIRLPLGNRFNKIFELDAIYVRAPTNLDFKRIREVRILPRNNCFYIEYVYVINKTIASVNLDRILGIDHGLDNWLTCVSSAGESFIVDGKKLKSKNQWYNKKVAQLKTGKPQGFWSDELASITEKRNRIMRDAVNKTARFIINYCLVKGIGRIVFGWNQSHKNGINIGHKNNQEFVSIPTARLKDRIAQLCEQYDIYFQETEESYTSKASFLDDDYLPKYGEKPKEWEPSGKRVSRGLYQTQKGWLINADCNGAANIIRKVSAQLRTDVLAEVCRAALSLPQRYDPFSSLSRSYRKQGCEGAFLTPVATSA